MTLGQNPPPKHEPPRLGHRPALDGIRGLAMLAVLGHNLGWPGFGGGFLGVDVFFALSGFLITTLLLEDHVRHGRISLRRFFLRRFLRLYPALVVLTGCSVILALWTAPRVDFSRVAAVAASVLGYWSNWLVIADPGAWFGGLNHTWSLAVEVHFYILWALIVTWVTVRRGCDWRTLGLIAAGLAMASASVRAVRWELGVDYHRLYGGTDMRLDAVLLGAGAGLLRWAHLAVPGQSILPRLSPGKIRAIELGGIGMVVFLIVTLTQQSSGPYLGGFTVAGGTTAVLILTALLYDGSWMARLASWAVLVWVGRVSYSLYLWHSPVAKMFSVARLSALGLSPILVEIVRLAACLAIAAVSYYSVERYFLRLKDRESAKVPSVR